MKRPSPLAVALFASASVLAACKRGQGGAQHDAAPSPPPTSSAPSPTEAARPVVYASTGPAAGEASSHFVAARETDPALRPFATRVSAHFKDPKTPLAVMRASLFGGGAATLVTELQTTSEKMPLLLVEDRERRLLWEKERPTAAMLPPVRDPVVLGRRGGGVALFAYDVPARVVAGRYLDADGTPFTDINVLRADDCQRVSAAFWPKRGTVVICARLSGGLLQIVRDDFTLAMPNEGAPVAAPFRLAAPISVGFDTQSTMVLAQYAERAGADHVVVRRYDAAGRPLWHDARDLGEVPKVSLPAPRIVVTGISDGVRVTVPSVPPRVAEVGSEGTIRFP